MKKYEYIEHTADIKFQAFGKSLEEVFENSALAMFNAISDDKIKLIEKKKISVFTEGKDNESLLYEFLEELLVLFDSEHFMLGKIENLNIKGKKLIAEISGDKVENYDIKIDVKAITYNDMFVKEEKETKEKRKFISQVVLDV